MVENLKTEGAVSAKTQQGHWRALGRVSDQRLVGRAETDWQIHHVKGGRPWGNYLTSPVLLFFCFLFFVCIK